MLRQFGHVALLRVIDQRPVREHKEDLPRTAWLSWLHVALALVRLAYKRMHLRPWKCSEFLTNQIR